MSIKLLTLIFLSLSLNAAEHMNQDKKLFELPMGCDFSKAGINHTMETECSPKLTDRFFSKFTGILINVQETITWPKNHSMENYQSYPGGGNDSTLKFSVAGLAKLPETVLEYEGEIPYEILVVAVNQKTAETYSGKMVKFGASGIKPTLELSSLDDLSPEFSQKYYFNIDMVSNAGLPIAEAVYTVYAMIGDYQSNIVIITTKLKNN